MKTVAHIVNEKVVRQQVPDDWNLMQYGQAVLDTEFRLFESV